MDSKSVSRSPKFRETKDHLPFEQKIRVVYNIKCESFDAEYIGETLRRLDIGLIKHGQSVFESD